MRRRSSKLATSACAAALLVSSAFGASPSLAQELPPPPPPEPLSAPLTPSAPDAAVRPGPRLDTGTSSAIPEVRSENPFDRRHTIAEAQIGFLALPSAPISKGTKGGETPLLGKVGKGDATLQVGVHLLFRGGRSWAIGAGALLTPLPTTDTLPPLTSGLVQTHARSYLFLGAEARFIPLRVRAFEGWVGVTVGGVVVADRYTTKAGDNVPPILGTKETTVHAIGLVGGVLAGLDWRFTDQLDAGVALRLDHWILPSDARCTSIGLCTTLQGPVTALGLVLKIGYSIPL